VPQTKLLIFDLDGTLLDTRSFIVPAVQDLLTQFFEAHQIDDLAIPSTCHIVQALGTPVDQYYRGLLPPAYQHLSPQLHHQGRLTLARWIRHGAASLYPQVIPILNLLYSKRWTLAIASNCDRPYLDAVLETFALDSLFDYHLCIQDRQHATKVDLVHEMLYRFPAEQVVLIGDRQSDIDAGHANGIPVIACRYGFGSPAELATADLQIECFTELPAVLQQLQNHPEAKESDC